MAPGITGPNQLEDVLGGGICQVSTTMFNAVAGGTAGLKITERHNHSMFIKHYPLGRDATVTGGGKDLRFVNDMQNWVWITGSSDGVTTTITVWGTGQGRSTTWAIGQPYGVVAMTKTTVTDPKLKAGKTSLSQSGQKGQSLKTTRVVRENGKVIDKNVWTNVWVMYPEITVIGTGSTSTTHPSSTGTTHPPTTGSTSTSTTSTTGLAP
jgi:vancomycin resistance protein YoaR